MAAHVLDAFLKSLPPDVRQYATKNKELTKAVSQRIELSRQAWPALHPIEPATFAAFVAERLKTTERFQHAFESEAWSDLYLACACVQKDPAALAHADKLMRGKVRSSLKKLRLDPAAVEDLVQSVLERLLVAPGGPPRIASYDGSGELAGWLRIVAIRDGVRLAQKHRREVSLGDALATTKLSSDDPELAYMKAHYRAEYKAAFRAAAEALTAEQRLLLRQHFVQGLNVDALARIYGVHRASAARRVAQAREELLANTRRQLFLNLKVSRAEVERIVELIQSRLDISLRDALRTVKG